MCPFVYLHDYMAIANAHRLRSTNQGVRELGNTDIGVRKLFVYLVEDEATRFVNDVEGVNCCHLMYFAIEQNKCVRPLCCAWQCLSKKNRSNFSLLFSL